MDIRTRIIEGAADLFKTYGLKMVTMDSLASHLGMSKRTIYEVFEDKDELLVEVLKQMAKKQQNLMEKILNESGNAINAIFRLLEINIDFFQNTSNAFQSDLKKYHYEVLMKKYDKCDMPDYRNNQQIIDRGIKERLFRKEINSDLANRCLYSLSRSVLDFELYPYENYTRKEVIKESVINYLRGISTQEGMELINNLERKF
jgi:AcrR family transcriptional regulator